MFCGRNVELVVSTHSLNHTHLRPRIGSFSRPLHCLLEWIYPTDDGVVGDDPCRNALFSVRYMVLKKYVFYWNKDHPTTRPCSQQDKCDLYIQLSYATNCHFVYFNYYVTLWNSLVLSLRIFHLCSSSAFCLTMTCPLTPIPCSCAQIPHIEQYGGIIA